MRTALLCFACVGIAACGGGRQPPVRPPDMAMQASCTDGVKNQDESDVDCGGTKCPKCTDSQQCNTKADCQGGICALGTCYSSVICSDGAKDGDESDVDCGGSCPPCGFGRICTRPDDCRSGACTAGSCASLKAALTSGKSTSVGDTVDPQAIAAADFDGDGVTDVVALSGSKSKGYILLGKGDGKFQTTVPSFACDQVSGPDTIAAGDVDGDGKPDLVATTIGDNTPRALLFINESQPGMPAFKDPKEIAQLGSTPTHPLLVDLDGDGKLDLLTLDADFDYDTNSYTMYVSINGGNGMFKAPRAVGVGDKEPVSPVVADFNGDGTLDVAFVSAEKIKWSQRKPDGSFGNWTDVPINPPNAMEMFGFSHIAAADFTPDAKADIIGLDPLGNALAIMQNFDDPINGQTTFTFAHAAATPSSPTTMVVADFDLDDKMDVAVLDSYDATVTLFIGQGNQKLSEGPTAGAGTSPDTMILADMNRDHRADLITVDSQNSEVTVILNNSR